MNKYVRDTIAGMRQATKKAGMNRYRFAWLLIDKYPNLVVDIIQQYLHDVESKNKGDA